MSEAVNIHLKNTNEIINIVELDARALGEALLNASRER